MTFADQLKRWRKHCSLTQEEAAIELDVSLRTLQEWEQGRSTPSAEGPVIKLIARLKKEIKA